MISNSEQIVLSESKKIILSKKVIIDLDDFDLSSKNIEPTLSKKNEDNPGPNQNDMPN